MQQDEELSLLVIPAVMAERERLFGGHYYAYEFVAEELPPLPPSATPATGKKRRGKKKKGARNTFLEHIRKVKNEQVRQGRDVGCVASRSAGVRLWFARSRFFFIFCP